MRRDSKAIYQTANEIDAGIKEREADAANTPPGPKRQSILIEIARLRMYAEAKRWIESQELSSGATAEQ